MVLTKMDLQDYTLDVNINFKYDYSLKCIRVRTQKTTGLQVIIILIVLILSWMAPAMNKVNWIHGLYVCLNFKEVTTFSKTKASFTFGIYGKYNVQWTYASTARYLHRMDFGKIHR